MCNICSLLRNVANYLMWCAMRAYVMLAILLAADG